MTIQLESITGQGGNTTVPFVTEAPSPCTIRVSPPDASMPLIVRLQVKLDSGQALADPVIVTLKSDDSTLQYATAPDTVRKLGSAFDTVSLNVTVVADTGSGNYKSHLEVQSRDSAGGIVTAAVPFTLVWAPAIVPTFTLKQFTCAQALCVFSSGEPNLAITNVKLSDIRGAAVSISRTPPSPSDTQIVPIKTGPEGAYLHLTAVSLDTKSLRIAFVPTIRGAKASGATGFVAASDADSVTTTLTVETRVSPEREALTTYSSGAPFSILPGAPEGVEVTLTPSDKKYAVKDTTITKAFKRDNSYQVRDRSVGSTSASVAQLYVIDVDDTVIDGILTPASTTKVRGGDGGPPLAVYGTGLTLNTSFIVLPPAQIQRVSLRRNAAPPQLLPSVRIGDTVRATLFGPGVGYLDGGNFAGDTVVRSAMHGPDSLGIWFIVPRTAAPSEPLVMRLKDRTEIPFQFTVQPFQRPRPGLGKLVFACWDIDCSPTADRGTTDRSGLERHELKELLDSTMQVRDSLTTELGRVKRAILNRPALRSDSLKKAKLDSSVDQTNYDINRLARLMDTVGEIPNYSTVAKLDALGTITIGNLANIHLQFDPELFDASRTPGVQYIMLDVDLLDVDGNLQQEHTTCVAIVPRIGTNLPLQVDSDCTPITHNDLNISDLVEYSHRAPAASVLQVRLRLNQAKYDAPVDPDIVLRFRNSGRFVFKPRVDQPGPLFVYLNHTALTSVSFTAALIEIRPLFGHSWITNSSQSIAGQVGFIVATTPSAGNAGAAATGLEGRLSFMMSVGYSFHGFDKTGIDLFLARVLPLGGHGITSHDAYWAFRPGVSIPLGGAPSPPKPATSP